MSVRSRERQKQSREDRAAYWERRSMKKLEARQEKVGKIKHSGAPIEAPIDLGEIEIP